MFLRKKYFLQFETKTIELVDTTFILNKKNTMHLFIRQREKKGNITTFKDEITDWTDTDIIQLNEFIVL